MLVDFCWTFVDRRVVTQATNIIHSLKKYWSNTYIGDTALNTGDNVVLKA